MLVLTSPILIGCLTGIALKKEQLTDSLICINTAVSTRRITELQGEVTLPAGFRWRRINNDA